MDINKEILETTLQAMKSQTNLRSVYNEDKSRYETEFSTNAFDVDIKISYKETRTWFSHKLYLDLLIAFKTRGYGSSTSNKSYKFPDDSDKIYDKYKYEIYTMLKDKYEADILAKEQKKDRDIIDSLNTIIDEKYKREDKIDDLLENE